MTLSMIFWMLYQTHISFFLKIFDVTIGQTIYTTVKDGVRCILKWQSHSMATLKRHATYPYKHGRLIKVRLHRLSSRLVVHYLVNMSERTNITWFLCSDTCF